MLYTEALMTMRNRYRALFSVREIENGRILQWAFGAAVLGYFIAFLGWMGSSATTIDAVARGVHSCWPYFQNCGDFYFLRALPEGYSQTFLYMVFFGMLVAVVYYIAERRWTAAHMALVPAFLWHATVTFVLTELMIGNYDYYLFTFGLILLFLPHKEFFLKLSLVFFYFLSTIAKMHEAWVIGTYFSSLKTGLPLFPDWSIPLMTNFVIFMEMIATWFLLGRNRVLQRSVLMFFIAFHLYSGLLVGYRYPATVLPMLIILFGPWYRYTPPPFDKKSLFGWMLIVLMLVLQLIPKFIPGDEKMTLEGNKYGLYMFESNHQCVSTATIYLENGMTATLTDESVVARARCDPYRYWFRLRASCDLPDIEHIAWTFDHSINGGPFYRIVDVPDACTLTYAPFEHNAWIRTAKDAPSIIGYPVENVYE